MAMATITAATAAAATTTPLRMKLLVDTRAQRVLFAEASKEVVDFLLSLLALPLGTVVMLLGNESVVGSVGNLYGSVENLERSYAQPGVDMDALLRPVVLPPAAGSVASLFPVPVPDPSAPTSCPSCGLRLQVQYTGRSASGGMQNTATTAAGGFVLGNMTYTVMDDLAIAPMSTINVITVFNTMAATDITAVRQRIVLIGYTEALKILKASFESRTVLTDVFIRNRDAPGLPAP